MFSCLYRRRNCLDTHSKIKASPAEKKHCDFSLGRGFPASPRTQAKENLACTLKNKWLTYENKHPQRARVVMVVGAICAIPFPLIAPLLVAPLIVSLRRKRQGLRLEKLKQKLHSEFPSHTLAIENMIQEYISLKENQKLTKKDSKEIMQNVRETMHELNQLNEESVNIFKEIFETTIYKALGGKLNLYNNFSPYLYAHTTQIICDATESLAKDAATVTIKQTNYNDLKSPTPPLSINPALCEALQKIINEIRQLLPEAEPKQTSPEETITLLSDVTQKKETL